MLGPVPVFSQVRTHRHIYHLKQKGSCILVRIYDYSRACLYKRHFDVEALKLPRKVTISQHPRAVIEHLIAIKVLGVEFAFPGDLVIKFKDCKERLQRAIQAYRPKVGGEFEFPKFLQGKVERGSAAVHLDFSQFNKEEETLIRLHLAKRYLDVIDLWAATEMLKSASQQASDTLEVPAALIELLLYKDQKRNQRYEIVQVLRALRCPEGEGEQQKLVRIYSRVLRRYPTDVAIFNNIKSIRFSASRDQLLLQGASAFLQAGNRKKALELSSKIRLTAPFIDHLIQINLLEESGQKIKALRRLSKIAHSYSSFSIDGRVQEIKAFKHRAYRNKSPFDLDILTLRYGTVGKGYKTLIWNFRYLSYLVSKEVWRGAQNLAEGLIKLPYDPRSKLDPLAVHKVLVEVYKRSDPLKLEDFCVELGGKYLDHNRINEAERIYLFAIEEFTPGPSPFGRNLSAFHFGLAKVYERQSKRDWALSTYHVAASLAIKEENLERFCDCMQKMRQLDPKLKFLEEGKRERLIYDEAEAHRDLKENSLRLEALQKEVQKLTSWSEVVNWVAAEGHWDFEERKEAALSVWAFGPKNWQRYFGAVGKVPELPKDILEILSAECLLSKRSNPREKKCIGDTHKLVLIPQTVNGKFFSLNMLQKIIQCPNGGGNKAMLHGVDQDILEGFGTHVPSGSYWRLISRSGIEKTRIGTLGQKAKFLHTLTKHLPSSTDYYKPASALEVATAIAVEYVETGQRLYPGAILTEGGSFATGRELAVGGFNAEGLHLINPHELNMGDEYAYVLSTGFYTGSITFPPAIVI